jgi:hypothetical protein
MTPKYASLKLCLAFAPCFVATLMALGLPARTDEVAWPGNQAGLVFLWEDASKTNQINDASGRPVRTCQAEPRGMARYSRFFGMDLIDGAFLAREVDQALLTACKRSGQLGMEALLTPRRTDAQARGQIITFSSGPHSRNFTLGQEGDRLVLQLRTGSPEPTARAVKLCRLTAGKPHHVIVSYSPGRLWAALNGAPVPVSAAVQGDFSNWTAQHLLFGEEWDRSHRWDGELEGIAIHSRAIPAEEARRRYTWYVRRLALRKPAEQVVVQARLVKATPVPTLQAIAPYRRCLIANEYAVEKVVQGRYGPATIGVAHWAILDGKSLPNDRKIGASYRLRLERFTDHPELESERLMMESDEFDLELFYDVGR